MLGIFDVTTPTILLDNDSFGIFYILRHVIVSCGVRDKIKE
jgi:hypothetical protein